MDRGVEGRGKRKEFDSRTCGKEGYFLVREMFGKQWVSEKSSVSETDPSMNKVQRQHSKDNRYHFTFKEGNK